MIHLTDKMIPSLSFCYAYRYGLETIWHDANLSSAMIACVCIRVHRCKANKCILIGSIDYVSSQVSAKTSNHKV